jgi:hypothetical protein
VSGEKRTQGGDGRARSDATAVLVTGDLSKRGLEIQPGVAGDTPRQDAGTLHTMDDLTRQRERDQAAVQAEQATARPAQA